MNAQEQIAMLRRACEITRDWYGNRLSVNQFHDKWRPHATSAGEFVDRAFKEAMEATATPPDSAEPAPSREFDVTFPTGADGVEIPTVVRLLVKTELVSEKLAECTSEEVARRIADLLNAGGGK